ncbi:MAG TPA: tetratricopeptide repeat protein [Candidatus Dormibacteraeota bacterium]|jgi:tetratricopeptide (TPR) repeat protein|nr:tetratricopeptide repeat protein [Candidatus Dormibacteraeota bacterium]
MSVSREKISTSAAGPRGLSARMELLILCLGAVLPYLETLRFGFVYDDDVQVLANPAIRNWHYLSAYFLKPIAGFYSAIASAHYYRPIFFLWFRLNYFCWHTQPWGWHLSSLLLHAAVSLFVLLVLRSYFPESKWVVFGALIFAVHPVHAETVAWVSGCTDALMVLGLLGSFYFWMRSVQTGRALNNFISLFCFAFALLSKEPSVVFPLIIFAHAFWGIPTQSYSAAKPAGLIPALRATLPYALLTVAYLALRFSMLHGIQPVAAWISLPQALLMAPYLFMFYLRHLVLPLNLSLFYDVPTVSSAFSVSFLLPLAFIVALIAALWLLYKRSQNLQLLAALQWLVLPLLPVLYIRSFQRDDFVHDRYLYLPVLALSISMVLLAELLSKTRTAAQSPHLPQLVLGVIVAALAATTLIQSRPWENNLALYTNAFRVAPKNSFARNNLASEYAARGHFLEANEVLKTLTVDRPDLWLANYNFGYSNYRLGNLDVAEEFLRRAIDIDPSDPDQYVYLGFTYYKENRLSDALNQIRLGIARKPDGLGYHYGLGMVYQKLGQLGAAKDEMTQELRFHPENTAAQTQLKALDQQMLTFKP